MLYCNWPILKLGTILQKTSGRYSQGEDLVTFTATLDGCELHWRKRPPGPAPVLTTDALWSACCNVPATSLDYAERLVRAKDLQEAAQIQSEFVRAQAEAMQTQMREFGSAMQSAMGRATEQAAAGADQTTSGTTRGRGGKS